MEDISGHYYVLEYRTRRETHEYRLDVLYFSEGKAKFKYELTVSRKFGTVGNDWEGTCFLKNDQLILESNKYIDWSHTFLDEERQNIIYYISKKFSLEILRGDGQIKLKLPLELKNLILCKIDEKFEGVSFSIIQEIINRYNLKVKIIDADPGVFWRVSNLILRFNKNVIFNGSEAFEIACENDLDTVKEEKRVVNYDEVIREHHADIIIVDNECKIIKYEKS